MQECLCCSGFLSSESQEEEGAALLPIRFCVSPAGAAKEQPGACCSGKAGKGWRAEMLLWRIGEGRETQAHRWVLQWKRSQAASSNGAGISWLFLEPGMLLWNCCIQCLSPDPVQSTWTKQSLTTSCKNQRWYPTIWTATTPQAESCWACSCFLLEIVPSYP